MKLLAIINSLVKGARFWCVSKSYMFIFPYASTIIEHFLFESLLSAVPSPDLKNKNLPTTLAFPSNFPFLCFLYNKTLRKVVCILIPFPFLQSFLPPFFFFFLEKSHTEKLKKWYNEHSRTLHLDLTIVNWHFSTHTCFLSYTHSFFLRFAFSWAVWTV